MLLDVKLDVWTYWDDKPSIENNKRMGTTVGYLFEFCANLKCQLEQKVVRGAFNTLNFCVLRNL